MEFLKTLVHYVGQGYNITLSF